MTPAAATLKRESAKARREALECSLAFQLKAAGLARGMVRQHKPFEDVGYAYDFAWPDRTPVVLVEVQGGIYTGGAHTRSRGVLRDMDKVNRAALRGWLVLQVSAEDIKRGKALQLIQEVLKP